jgi:hypothetical protein
MPHDAEQFFQLYERYRYSDQFQFYTSRQKEFSRAQNQALTISIGLIFLAALAGALETIPLPWFKLACLLLAAICPVLSTALTAYNTLYAFEQQAKLYRDALYNLQKVRVHLPEAHQGLSEDHFVQQLHTYVHEVEKILQVERGQWGQLARNMKPPEI